MSKNAAYLYLPESSARSRLSINFLERKLGISMTSRDFNTMKKLIEMSKNKDQNEKQKNPIR